MTSPKILDYFFSDISRFSKRDSIILDERYLSDGYLPEDIRFRDRQKEEILTAVNEFIDGNGSFNLVLYGPPGTGKTLLSKYVFYGIKAYSIKMKMKISPLYINCRFYNTKESLYYIFGKIFEELSGVPFRAGMRRQEIIDKVFEYLKEKDIRLLLILDEVDFLFKTNEINDLLYMLLRGYDLDLSNKMSFILISNNISFISYFDPRVSSSFSSTHLVEFTPYDSYQLTEILKERVRLAFREGSVPDSIIKRIAAKVAQISGDARLAINILKLSAFYAMSKKKDKIDDEDIEEAFENIDIDIVKKAILSMNKEQRIIFYSLVKKQIETEDMISLKEIYEEYMKIKTEMGLSPLSYDGFRKNFLTIETLLEKMIETDNVSEGRKGYKKLVRLLIDRDKLKSIQEEIKKYI